jgi:hypothetical protein
MSWKLPVAVSAVLVCFGFCANFAQAEENVRLVLNQSSNALSGGLSGDPTTRNLLLTDEGLNGGISGGSKTRNLLRTDDDDADNLLAYYRGGRGGWGGYRGGWGGYRGGWAGHRGWGWGGGWRGWGWGWRGWGWGRPYWGYAWRPFYRPWYYTPYYYAPPVYYYSYPTADYYSYPLTFDINLNGVGLRTALGSPPSTNYGTPAPPTQTLPYPRLNGNSPTYPYDGGPQNPVPLPKSGREAIPAPTPTVPLDGRAVSIPARPAPKFAYPAYGETPARTQFAQERAIVIKK